jgi:hypothetical protein
LGGILAKFPWKAEISAPATMEGKFVNFVTAPQKFLNDLGMNMIYVYTLDKVENPAGGISYVWNHVGRMNTDGKLSSRKQHIYKPDIALSRKLKDYFTNSLAVVASTTEFYIK